MKCPNCSLYPLGHPFAGQEMPGRHLDMATNHRDQNGKLYLRCNSCGFLIEQAPEAPPPEPEHPAVAENASLVEKNAELKAEIYRLQALLHQPPEPPPSQPPSESSQETLSA